MYEYRMFSCDLLFFEGKHMFSAETHQELDLQSYLIWGKIMHLMQKAAKCYCLMHLLYGLFDFKLNKK